MIITCEQCGISFKLDENLLKPEGSKVRCSKCKHIFLAFPPLPEPEPEPEIEIEPETKEETTEAAVSFDEAETGLGEDETDLGRDEEGEEPVVAESGDDLDLDLEEDDAGTDDLDLDLEEDDAGTDELDLDLEEDDAGTDELELDLEKDDADADDMELDLDLDEDEPEVEEIEGELELDLEKDDADTDDMELDLDLDEDEPEVEEIEGELELDLEKDEADDDLALALDDDEISETKPEPSSQDMEIELDEDDEEENLDFSEVDDLLDTDEPPLGETTEEESDDLDLDLDDDDDTEASVEQQEIDLGDLEQTIEMELLEPDEEEEEEEDREDVELELADSDDDEGLDEDLDEIDETAEAQDFSDIEKMLEDEEGEELKLDEAEEAAEKDAAEEKAAGKKKKAKKKKTKPEKAATAGEIDKVVLVLLTFFLGGIGIHKLYLGKYLQAALYMLFFWTGIPGLIALVEFFIYIFSSKESLQKKYQTGDIKKSLLTIVLMVVIMGLLAAGAVFMAAPYLTTGVETEGIGKMFRPAEKRPVVVPSSLEADFVTNENIGKMFIIKGQVSNKTDKKQNFLQVKANLYTKGNNVTESYYAYCGNILTLQELHESSLETINQRLGNKFGDNRQNMEVKPGQTIPFMLIIPERPPDLIEYEVMLAQSPAPGKK